MPTYGVEGHGLKARGVIGSMACLTGPGAWCMCMHATRVHVHAHACLHVRLRMGVGTAGCLFNVRVTGTCLFNQSSTCPLYTAGQKPIAEGHGLQHDSAPWSPEAPHRGSSPLRP